ncbi:MAG: hypothetical protein LBR08_11015 [Bacteroidales bacterium]|nr:hypothetical protein [Bacteroidales bacterium]
MKFCLLFICLVPGSLRAQQKFEAGGYISDMPSLMWFDMPPLLESEGYWQNLVHNRLNLGWQMTDKWRIDAGMRNRFITGSEYLIQPGEISFDKGLADVSWNYFETGKAVLNTAFDRFYITFERNRWKLRLGRQRINWGQTFVWNPNDIFNAYSFFDFDYAERPGCDAFHATYYHSETASSELAASVNRDGRVTAALMHHWNRGNIDFQTIGGVVEESDAVFGGAWTGDVSGLNFRGEFSVFRPLKNFADTATTIAISAGLDYIFSNSLMLQAEVLYNNVGRSGNFMNLMNAADLSAKRLSICDRSVFAQASYPVTPRLNGSLSGMYFVEVKACYAGLSLDLSLADNLDLSVITQYFTTVKNDESSMMKALLGFLRLKYSF